MTLKNLLIDCPLCDSGEDRLTQDADGIMHCPKGHAFEVSQGLVGFRLKVVGRETDRLDTTTFSVADWVVREASPTTP